MVSSKSGEIESSTLKSAFSRILIIFKMVIFKEQKTQTHARTHTHTHAHTHNFDLPPNYLKEFSTGRASGREVSS